MNDPVEQFEQQLKQQRPAPLRPELEQRLLEATSASDAPAPRSRWWIGALVAAACLIAAVSIFLPTDPPVEPLPPNAVALASGWIIEPTGDAAFAVGDDGRVKLDRGELLVYTDMRESNAPPASGLFIDTPDGTTHSGHARFYIGSHTANPKGPAMKRFTRVLVLFGAATLTNPLGSITGNANDLLAAEPDAAPVKTTVTTSSEFAVDLYHQLARENEGENLFFSPYSISTALSMTIEGARGQTMQEMGRVLRFPKAAQRTGDDAQKLPWQTSTIHTGFSKLNAQFNRDDKPYELAVANALWGEQTFSFRPEFEKTIDESYGTGAILPMDFKGDPDGSRRHINAWVEAQTNKRIKDLIPSGEINPLTRLVLTNAIYFKGDWANKFDKKHTRVRDFTRVDGSKVKAPIMWGDLPGRTASAKIDDRHYAQLLELPYKGDELSMVLIGGYGAPLGVIEKNLTAENLGKWVGSLRKSHRPISVSLPKFKVESEYKLNDTLKTMGMPTAFIRGKADFTGLNESAGRKLFIKAVLHKGFVEVSEEGTEAAAATAVIIQDESAGPMFDGTRPFLYLIRDTKTGAILFLGRMLDPTAK